MGLETDNAPPATAAPTQQPDATAAAKRLRAPRSPEELRQASERSAASRMLGKLKGAKTVDELLSRVDELRGKKKPDNAAGAAQPQAAPQTQVPPGWPSPQATAQWVPKLYVPAIRLIQRLPEKHRPKVETLDMQLPKVQPDGKVQVETTTVVIDPAQELAQGCAPLVAQLTEGKTGTPAQAAVVSLVMVLGVPLLLTAADAVVDRAWPRVVSWWKAQVVQEPAAKTQPQATQRPQLVEGGKKP